MNVHGLKIIKRRLQGGQTFFKTGFVPFADDKKFIPSITINTFFIENEFQHEGLTKLIVTEDMSERKKKMIELGDAFIAFPGGTGTLEEIAEVMSKVSLKHLSAPCILYNLDGYYNGLKALLHRMTEKGLSSEERQAGIYFAENLDEIKRILRSA